jgi:hypothetical protein
LALACVAESEPKDCNDDFEMGRAGFARPSLSEYFAAAPKTIDIQVEPKS